jgi:transketolase
MDKHNIRRNILEAAVRSREGHIPSSFSIVEMLIAIYNFEKSVGAFSPQNIVLSKGHASYAYYSFLLECGLMSMEEFEEIGEVGSKFYGHVPYIAQDPRFSFGSGSLGHGLPYAIGLGYARSMKGSKDPVYCIVGDGEANEGTFWESLLFIQKLRLSNINILIDANDSSERAIPIRKSIEHLNSCFPGIAFHNCDGHDERSIESALASTKNSKLIMCNTKKGFPVPFMIGSPMWHHKTPSPEDITKIMEYLL